MSKFEDFGRAIDEELQDQKARIYWLEGIIDELNYRLSIEKTKRLEAAKRLREFVSWLETEE